ncbi:MAG: DUF2798 domain-containing protein [Rhodocyclaceae bacterium]|nr:DUF2798 domain-containing protein [Rhodocyclaceae bacterium]
MIPAKYTTLVFAFFMSMLMAFMMSGVLTFINLRPISPGLFLQRWMQAFPIAWFFAFFAALLSGPIVRKIVTKLIAQPPRS